MAEEGWSVSSKRHVSVGIRAAGDEALQVKRDGRIVAYIPTLWLTDTEQARYARLLMKSEDMLATLKVLLHGYELHADSMSRAHIRDLIAEVEDPAR